jgi:hypothetical protein
MPQNGPQNSLTPPEPCPGCQIVDPDHGDDTCTARKDAGAMSVTVAAAHHEATLAIGRAHAQLMERVIATLGWCGYWPTRRRS